MMVHPIAYSDMNGTHVRNSRPAFPTRVTAHLALLHGSGGQ